MTSLEFIAVVSSIYQGDYEVSIQAAGYSESALKARSEFVILPPDTSEMTQTAVNTELLDQMKAGGAVWDTMADEIIRWATPTSYFRRTATEDYEMHGKTIRKGDKVLFWFASGNRDEDQFENPNRVDLMRSPNKHLAFGLGGPHLCLGMWLARLEVRVLFEELSKRITKIEADGPQQFLRSNFISGIKSLPVRIKRA